MFAPRFCFFFFYEWKPNWGEKCERFHTESLVFRPPRLRHKLPIIYCI